MMNVLEIIVFVFVVQVMLCFLEYVIRMFGDEVKLAVEGGDILGYYYGKLGVYWVFLS